LGSILVTLRVDSQAAYEWLEETLSVSNGRLPELKVVPVLFTLGINEVQSIANAAFSTAIQTEVNRKGAADLRAYRDSASAAIASGDVSENDKVISGLLDSLDLLVEAEARDKKKLVELLLVSCYAARLLHGARTTSCKSAKDRTSMFHTLEVARLAERHGFLSREREPAVLERLRGLEGVRLRNCEHNVGRPKYSFNQLQLQALPMELRPLANTASGGKS
jgi:inositol polyphosphate-4-phosphatase